MRCSLALWLWPLLALTACGSSAPDASQADSAQPDPASPDPVQSDEIATPIAPETPAIAPRAIIGEWRLAGIDGADPNWRFGVAISIDTNSIAVMTPCAPMEWTYRYDGAGGLEIDPEKQLPVAINESMQCADGPLVEERTLFGIFNGLTGAHANADGSIALTGHGHGVTLFSQ